MCTDTSVTHEWRETRKVQVHVVHTVRVGAARTARYTYARAYDSPLYPLETPRDAKGAAGGYGGGSRAGTYVGARGEERQREINREREKERASLRVNL